MVSHNGMYYHSYSSFFPPHAILLSYRILTSKFYVILDNDQRRSWRKGSYLRQPWESKAPVDITRMKACQQRDLFLPRQQTVRVSCRRLPLSLAVAAAAQAMKTNEQLAGPRSGGASAARVATMAIIMASGRRKSRQTVLRSCLRPCQIFTHLR